MGKTYKDSENSIDRNNQREYKDRVRFMFFVDDKEKEVPTKKNKRRSRNNA